MHLSVIPRLLVPALLLAVSCTGDPSGAPNTPVEGRFSPSPSATFYASCDVSPHLPPDNAVQGETNDGELWALPPGPWEPQVGEDFRVTVHVTGAGDFAVNAIAPDGSQHRPAVGPVRQFGAGSGLERPGDEWSMVFRFDQPGCWQIDITRGELQGAIGFEVLR